MQSTLNVFSSAGSGQALSPTSSPTFTGLTVNGNVTLTGTLTQTGNTTQTGNETVLGLSTSTNFETAQLSAPSAPVSVTNAGTPGAVGYTYAYTAVDALGKETQIGSTTATATGPTTLNSTNYNVITAPALPAGAVSLKLYRTVNGTTATAIGLLASGLAGSAVTNDQGGAVTAFLYSSAFPSQNYTGGIQTNTRAPAWVNKNDPSTAYFWDDFFSVTQSTTVATTGNALQSCNTFTGTAIVANTGYWESFANTDGIHYGVVQIGNSTATSGDGCMYSIGGGSQSAGQINPSTALFDFIYCFKLVQGAVSNGFCAGIITPSPTTIPTTNATTFYGIRFDTSVDSTNYQFIAQTGSAGGSTSSGVPVDANWHVFRMRSVVAGTLLYSLDGGPETSINTHIANSTLSVAFGQINRTTTAAYQYVDYIGVQLTGLVR